MATTILHRSRGRDLARLARRAADRAGGDHGRAAARRPSPRVAHARRARYVAVRLPVQQLLATQLQGSSLPGRSRTIQRGRQRPRFPARCRLQAMQAQRRERVVEDESRPCRHEPLEREVRLGQRPVAHELRLQRSERGIRLGRRAVPVEPRVKRRVRAAQDGHVGPEVSRPQDRVSAQGRGRDRQGRPSRLRTGRRPSDCGVSHSHSRRTSSTRRMALRFASANSMRP